MDHKELIERLRSLQKVDSVVMENGNTAYGKAADADDKSELRRIVNAEVAKFKEFRDRLWQTNPEQSGMDDGVASRVERYEAIGNGQVSIVAATALWSLANA